MSELLRIEFKRGYLRPTWLIALIGWLIVTLGTALLAAQHSHHWALLASRAGFPAAAVIIIAAIPIVASCSIAPARNLTSFLYTNGISRGNAVFATFLATWFGALTIVVATLPAVALAGWRGHASWSALVAELAALVFVAGFVAALSAAGCAYFARADTTAIVVVCLTVLLAGVAAGAWHFRHGTSGTVFTLLALAVGIVIGAVDLIIASRSQRLPLRSLSARRHLG